MTDIECILSCPEHGPQFKIERVPTEREGGYTNQPIIAGDGKSVERAKACPTCGGALTREDQKGD